MPYLDNHLITLNSSDAIQLNSSYLSNVVFPFRGLLKDDVNILRSYITLINAQIPVSFYIIDATNNTLGYYDPVANAYTTISIAIGNYNASTIITALNAAIIANSSIATFSFNPLNGKISVGSSLLVISGNGQKGTTIGNVLGLGIGGANNFTFPYPLNLLGNNKLFINSSNLNNVAYTSHNTGFSTCICTIPINVPPYGLIQYSSLTDQNKNILVNRVLDTIDIQVLDLNNNFVNFNNANWSITIVLSIERMDANKFHIQNFHNYLMEDQPIQPEEIELNPPEKDTDLEFLMGGSGT